MDNQQSVWFQIEAQLAKQTIQLLFSETIWWKTQWQIWLQQLPNSISLHNFFPTMFFPSVQGQTRTKVLTLTNVYFMMKNCLVHHMTSVNNMQRLSIWKLKNYIQDKFAWSKLTEKQEKQTYNIYFIIDFIKFASLVILKPPAAKKLIFFLFLCVLVILLKGQVCDVVIELLLFQEFYTISFGLWTLE